MSAKKRARGKEQGKAKAAPGRLPFYRRHPDWTVAIGLAGLLLAFYGEVVFYSRTLLPPDALASKSFVPFIRQCLSEGEYPKWNPYIFCGMPSFASLNAAPYVDLLSELLRGLLWLPSRILPGGEFLFRLANYFLLGWFAYLYLRQKGIRPEAAAFAATTLVLLPQVVAYAAFGHGTKLNSVALIPLILFLADELFERRTLLLFAATALSIGLQLLRAHVQISYYTFLMLGMYVLWRMVWQVVRDRRLEARLVVGALLLAGAIATGVVMSSWLYLSVHEYSQYSIRGGLGGGLSYDYATGWSFPPKEILTFFIPSYFGFGGQTYWGPMPFTDFPMYFGITVLFLSVVALVLRRDWWTWFLFAVAIFSLVVSFGRHFPVLYDLMFRYLPYFNKFRVPVMIQILMEISAAFLAAAGLHELLLRRGKPERLRPLIYSFAAVVLVLFAIVLLGKGALLQAMERSGKLNPAEAQMAYRMALQDALKMLALVGVLLALVWSFLRGRVGVSWLVLGSFALLVADLWPVSHRLLQPQPKAQETEYFRADPAVQFVKKQEGLFRVFPVGDTRPPNWYAYHFLQSIYGYHAAKLRLYQSFLDSTRIADTDRFGFPLFLNRYYQVVQRGGRLGLDRSAPGSFDPALAELHDRVLDLLNVKYILSPYPFSDSSYQLVQRGQLNVMENPNALPRAFLVKDVLVARNEAEAYAILKSRDFDPARTAVFFERPSPEPAPGASGTVRVTGYGPHRILLDTETSAPACLVLSEVYYPAGWKARIDGQPTRIYRADVILRGLIVPAGKHRVEMVFDPDTFRVGLWVTVVVTAVLLALGIVAWFVKGQRFASGA